MCDFKMSLVSIPAPSTSKKDGTEISERNLFIWNFFHFQVLQLIDLLASTQDRRCRSLK